MPTTQHYQLLMTGCSIYYKIISLGQNYQQFCLPATLFKYWPSKCFKWHYKLCCHERNQTHVVLNKNISGNKTPPLQAVNAQLPPPYRVCHSTSSFARSLRAALCFSSSLSFSLLATSSKHFNRNRLFSKIETKKKCRKKWKRLHRNKTQLI